MCTARRGRCPTRASATSATAASTSARRTRNGSSPTSVPATPSSSRTPSGLTARTTAPTTGSCRRALVPDPDPALRIQEQLVVRGDLEGVVEDVDVADDAIAAELRRRVRVDGQPPNRLGVTGFGAPHLRPAEEHPLHTGQPVDDGRFLAAEGQ